MEGPIFSVVVGSGAFGTAMASLLARNGHIVKMLVLEPEIVESINKEHRNCVFMSEYTLRETITATQSPVEAFQRVNGLIVWAIPVQFSHSYCTKIAQHIPKGRPIVCISKGITTDTLELMCQVLPRALKDDPHSSQYPLAFVSGPSFAQEIIEDQHTAVVAASHNPAVAKRVQQLMSNKKFRVYTSTDVIGVEIGGAVKNVIAIAAGIAEGVGIGKNGMAAMITRGNAEMKKLAVAMGANAMTLGGLSGMGDLVLTCYGSLSRNRTVGKKLGEGMTLSEIMKRMKSVAEGVPTAKAAVALAKKHGVTDLPLITGVHLILEGKVTAKEAIEALMNRPLREED